MHKKYIISRRFELLHTVPLDKTKNGVALKNVTLRNITLQSVTTKRTTQNVTTKRHQSQNVVNRGTSPKSPAKKRRQAIVSYL
jgi:hypothetical protein